MAKVLIALLAGLALVGCAPSAREKTFPLMPAELADCKVYEIDAGDGMAKVTTMRCPNSSTSANYRSSKTGMVTVVIDGQTYTRAEQPGQ